MYICPTCGAETTLPSYKNNRPFCVSGHRVYNDSALVGLLNGVAWGVVLLICACLGQNWILAVPFAAGSVALYKGWQLSRRNRPSRKLARTFLYFAVGVLLPFGLLVYPGLPHLRAILGLHR